jgi:hypothetical protein
MNSDVDDFISVDGGDDDGIDGWCDLQRNQKKNYAKLNYEPN